MKTNVTRILTLIYFASIFVSCSKYDTVIKLDDFDKEVLSYDDLPENIQNIYRRFASVELLKDTIINKTENKNIKLYNPALHDDQFGLIREGFNHIFIVNDSYALKLKANKGSPFIFSDNSFYYTQELNLNESNFRNSNFIKIELRKVFGHSGNGSE